VTARRERGLLLATPVVAAAAVALGLRLGASGSARAAIVRGAPASAAGTGLAWQVAAFDAGPVAREPLAAAPLTVVARLGGHEAARWTGVTNGEGVAEALLPIENVAGLSLEVRSVDALLARGPVEMDPARPRRAEGVWMLFARRDGPIALDVAVPGGRVAPGFPASVWIRATLESTHAPVAGAVIDLQQDASLSFARSTARTDSRGWAEVTTTPAGLALSFSFTARTQEGLTGEWVGGLQAAPGGAWIRVRERYGTNEGPEIEIVAPSSRASAYLEVDDARGRAWATTLTFASAGQGAPTAFARAPPLAPGLYWAVVASDPSGAEQLAPSASVRPFFVAPSDEAALRLGPDPGECVAERDVREMPRALSACLAVAPFAAVPRWTALDGFDGRRGLDRQRRDRGLAVAVGALALAGMLELLLLLRAATRSAAHFPAELSAAAPPRVISSAGAGRVALALFISLLGFALLAVFLLRVG